MRDDLAAAEALSAPEQPSPAEMADDDPRAPWMLDPLYGGMSPLSRRKSWEGSQRRKAEFSVIEGGQDADTPQGDDAPLPNGIEDYDLPAGGINGPELVPAAPLVSPPTWPKEPPPRVAWVAHNLIPRGDVSSLGGDGGSGKTMLALQLATAMARGAQDWLGAVVDPGPVVFLSGEEPEDEIRRRVARIGARQGFDCDVLADLHFWFPSDFAGCTFATPGPGGVMQATPLFRSIEAAITERRPALVVLDNVAAVFAGNQNDRVMVRTFVNLFRGMARTTGCGVLLLDHPSLSGMQNGTGRGGNMDWRNSVRAALHLKAAEDKADADRGVRILECVKNNYAPLAAALRLEWVDGGSLNLVVDNLSRFPECLGRG